MTTLADRKARAQSGADLPRASFTVTFLSGESLFEEVKALMNECADLEVEVERQAKKIQDELDNPRPRKGADTDTPATRKAEAEAKIAANKALIAEKTDSMAEHQADVALIGMTSGEWQRWREAHPPRVIGHRETAKPNGDVETGDPIYHPDDLELTKVLPWSVAPSCSAADVDELLLDRFIATVGGEELEDGGWRGWLADAILWQDRRGLIRAAVVAHEQTMVRLPKVQNLPPTPNDSDNSDSPATSESPASDS